MDSVQFKGQVKITGAVLGLNYQRNFYTGTGDAARLSMKSRAPQDYAALFDFFLSQAASLSRPLNIVMDFF